LTVKTNHHKPYGTDRLSDWLRVTQQERDDCICTVQPHLSRLPDLGVRAEDLGRRIYNDPKLGHTRKDWNSSELC
jgi:hypothetical protein